MTPKSLAPLAIAAAMVASAPAQADVTLINVFEVPDGKETEVLYAWEKARDFLSKEPGYISTALHRAVTPDARFQLINVARWETPDAFKAATQRMHQKAIFPKIEGLSFTPALYQVVRSDGQ